MNTGSVTTDVRESALASLPWLVNGTLEGDEALAARAAVGHELEARRQLREIEALAAIVREAPLLAANAGLGFERLRAAIDGAGGATAASGVDGATAASGAGDGCALDRNWARPTQPVPIPPTPARSRHRGLALAAGVLLALLARESAHEPSFVASYRTLTSAPESKPTLALRVVFDSTLDAAAIDARLASHGARRVGEVGAHGAVQVELARAGASGNAVDELAAALARDPAVRLVGASPP